MTTTESGQLPTASAGRFAGTIAIVIVAIAVLLFADTLLARVDTRESHQYAEGLYHEGLVLLARNDAHEASDRLASAHAINRQDDRYSLALAQAMLADDRPAEAEQVLRTLLDRSETNGPANLTMARLRLSRGHASDAISYYHRAIFGEWGADSVARRFDTRLELIKVLHRRNQREAMLAELLPLEAMRGEDDSLRRVLARLFIEAGAPERGAAMLRDLLRDDKKDVGSYAGLGEAALALGNFRTAHANFATALRLHPGDSAISHRMDVADSALAIDPTRRGLGAATRWQLSQLLLSRTVAALERCGNRLTPQRADSLRAIASRPSPRDAVAEAELAIGEALSLWASRPVACQRRPFYDEPLSLVLDNAAQ